MANDEWFARLNADRAAELKTEEREAADQAAADQQMASAGATDGGRWVTGLGLATLRRIGGVLRNTFGYTSGNRAFQRTFGVTEAVRQMVWEYGSAARGLGLPDPAAQEIGADGPAKLTSEAYCKAFVEAVHSGYRYAAEANPNLNLK